MLIGQLIAEWRERHGYTLRELAKIIGIETTALHRLEHGKDIRDRPLGLVICWLLTDLE